MISKIKSFLWSKKYILIFIFLFLIVLTQRFLSDKQNGLVVSVSSDGRGYYCYLPAAIIYQDFSYNYYHEKENNINKFYQPFLTPYKDKAINKYYCGTAFCLLPFFLLGILISFFAGTDINGYTDTFLMLVSIAPLFYFLLSTYLISKIAKHFSISEKISLITCLIFFFSTNLFHYSIQEPSMSHAYSFFAVTLFLYCYMRLYEQVTTKKLLIIGLALGLVVLIRPVNIVVVLFTPFFSQNLKEYALFIKSLFIKHFSGVILFFLVMFLAIIIQFMFYYFQTGEYFIVTYEGETFNFKKPEIMNVLFSYRKGIFVYVPILLASFIFIFVTKNNWFKKSIFFISFSVFIYITSSWGCWWYGEGFSIRPVIDFLPVFIIILMFIYNKISIAKKRIVLIIVIPFLFLNQLMAYQYSNLMIDRVNMDKQKFWDVFLQTEIYKVNEKRIANLLKDENKIVRKELMEYENDFNDNRVMKDEGYNSKHSAIVGKENHFSKGFDFPLKELNINETFYIIVECMAKTNKEGKDLGLVVSIFEKDNCTKWNVIFRNQFPMKENEWVKMTQVVEIDKYSITPDSYLKIFANTEKGNNLIDNLKYTVVRK